MIIKAYLRDSLFPRTVPHKTTKFSAGEVQVSIDNIKAPGADCLRIISNIKSSDDLMEVLIATDALRRYYDALPIELNIPYLPYSRQDRVMEPGQSLSVRVFAKIINAQKYARVITWDCHSDVGPALINNCDNVPVEDLLTQTALSRSDYISAEVGTHNTVLVAPDAGAIKKVTKLSQRLGIPFLRADKTRDVKTGNITGTVVHPNPEIETLEDKHFLIVDDICDGGRTFIELAKVLRPLTKGTINLYVTHGIFSQGVKVFDGVIDRVFVANPFIELPAGNVVQLKHGML